VLVDEGLNNSIHEGFNEKFEDQTLQVPIEVLEHKKCEDEGSYQTFEEDQDPPHEFIEKEYFDEAYYVEDQLHEEYPIGKRTPPREDEYLVSYRSSQNC